MQDLEDLRDLKSCFFISPVMTAFSSLLLIVLGSATGTATAASSGAVIHPAVGGGGRTPNASRRHLAIWFVVPFIIGSFHFYIEDIGKLLLVKIGILRRFPLRKCGRLRVRKWKVFRLSCVGV